MKKIDFLYMNEELDELLSSIDNELTLLSSTVAFLYQKLTRINWCGFYLLDKDVLKLGPFQGLVACTTIPVGKGVCGKSVALKETILVSNVLEYVGHIACDSRTRSELVIPIFIESEIYGVLDIDSKIINRFTNTDRIFLEGSVLIFVKNLLRIRNLS